MKITKGDTKRILRNQTCENCWYLVGKYNDLKNSIFCYHGTREMPQFGCKDWRNLMNEK